MSQLSSYPNVFNTCLVLLRKSEYQLSYNRADDTWTAKKGSFSFLADNPIELLGLVSIYEKMAPSAPTEYWWQVREPNILKELDPE